MATYKMLKTHRGVRAGEIHPVLFRQGKTYELDDDLAAQFEELEITKPSKEKPSDPLAADGNDAIHENWLDTDPAVLRHGELTAEEVIARDESPATDEPAIQEEGRAEGERKTKGDAPENKAKKGK